MDTTKRYKKMESWGASRRTHEMFMKQINQMSIDRIKKNKAFIEHYELEFAPDFRREYIAYCEIMDKRGSTRSG